MSQTEYFYTITPENLIELAGSQWRISKRSPKWLTLRRCPVCCGGRSGSDRDTFAVNRQAGFYTCLRAKCGASGSFWSLIELAGLNPRDYLDREQMKRANAPLHSLRGKPAYRYRRDGNAF